MSYTSTQNKKVHVFSKSVVNGSVGAGIAMDHLVKLETFKKQYGIEENALFIQSVEDDKMYQKMGVDFLFHRKEGEPLKVEVKTELYVTPEKPDSQQNVFFEVVSNDTKGVLGWTYSTKADIVIYYMPFMGLALFMPFPHTAEWLKNNEKKFASRLRSSKNPRYSSHGYAINYKVYGHEMKAHLGESLEYYKFPQFSKETWDGKVKAYTDGTYVPKFMQ